MIINDSTNPDILFPPHVGRGLDLSSRPRGLAYDSSADPFPSELIIARSEWQARIEEIKERKSGLDDICRAANLQCKDQKQTNFCHVADTEVLTERGWISWPDYNGKDLLGTMNPASGFLEFQAPLQTHVFEHDGRIIYSNHKSIDFGVTNNHRMLVRATPSSNFIFCSADKLPNQISLPASTTGHYGVELDQITILGDRTYSGDSFIVLLALIISTGGTGYRQSVVFKRNGADKIAYQNGYTKEENTWIRHDAPVLANWLRANIYTGAQNKCVPNIIKNLSSRQINLFLEALGFNQYHAIASTSERLADDIQELLLRIGKRGTRYNKKQAGNVNYLEDQKITPQYYVYERSTDKLSIQKKDNLEYESYKGNVYCATVPNNTLITRRNGTILISGNCWCNAPTYCVEVVRVLQNQEAVVLSPASVGGQLKGYQNVGGWGKEALEWITEHGVVPVDKWPANAIDKQYATSDNKELALNYRVTEWWEIEPHNMDQVVSALLRRLPIAVGFNWWSHEVTMTGVDWKDNDIAIQIRNSWGMSWGTEGYAILQGRKMLPDDAVCPRVVVAS